MNEIAVVKQLPIITERIKEIGQQLNDRIEKLNLDNLVCSEETKKEIKELRTTLSKEQKLFEDQRKDIKNKIMTPYEEFNKIYEEEIKIKYQNADNILKNKIDEVESEIKHNTEMKMKEFFDEYKKSKNAIQENYLQFHELDIKLGLNLLTEKGELVKKVKDEIKQKVDSIEKDIETISTMQYSDEILVEYLKHKNLSLAIKDVNDRHFVLESLKESERETEIKVQQEKQVIEQVEQVIEQVEEVLQAPTEEEPIDGQMTIDEFEEQNVEELLEITFTVRGTRMKLKELKEFLTDGGYDYE